MAWLWGGVDEREMGGRRMMKLDDGYDMGYDDVHGVGAKTKRKRTREARYCVGCFIELWHISCAVYEHCYTLKCVCVDCGRHRRSDLQGRHNQ